MIDLSTKEIFNMIHEKLIALDCEVYSSKIALESIFPCIELHNPQKSVKKTQNAFPIISTFQVMITAFSDNKITCMEITDNVDNKLKDFNFIRISTNQCEYDLDLEKYKIIVTYEVSYNALTNSFEVTK